jgi:hypothetical protein
MKTLKLALNLTIALVTAPLALFSTSYHRDWSACMAETFRQYREE